MKKQKLTRSKLIKKFGQFKGRSFVRSAIRRVTGKK